MEEFLKNTDGLTDEVALMILALYSVQVAMEEQKQFGPIWEEFEQSLIYKNRFSADSLIISEIEKAAKNCSKVYRAGDHFFRARSYNADPSEKFAAYYQRKCGVPKKTFKEQFEILSLEEIQALFSSMIGMSIPENSSDFLKSLVDIRDEWVKHVRFKGFNAKDSAAPPAEKSTEGRINPAYIRYLYVCEEEETTAFEISPNLNDTISIATLSLEKEARVFDFACETSLESYMPSLFHLIQTMFSRPNKSNPKHYIATQYLAEKIKNMGFDGIRFRSSLRSDGINVVFFDPEICIPISSKLVFVTGIQIQTIDNPFL